MDAFTAGVAIAIFGSTIVEFIFRWTANRAPMINAALQGEYYAEDPTKIGHTVFGAVVGAQAKSDRRFEPRE